jgi:hypothetical protein
MMMTGKGNLELIVGSEPRYEPGVPNINNVLTISGKGWGGKMRKNRRWHIRRNPFPLSTLLWCLHVALPPVSIINSFIFPERISYDSQNKHRLLP